MSAPKSVVINGKIIRRGTLVRVFDRDRGRALERSLYAGRVPIGIVEKINTVAASATVLIPRREPVFGVHVSAAEDRGFGPATECERRFVIFEDMQVIGQVKRMPACHRRGRAAGRWIPASNRSYEVRSKELGRYAKAARELAVALPLKGDASRLVRLDMKLEGLTSGARRKRGRFM